MNGLHTTNSKATTSANASATHTSQNTNIQFFYSDDPDGSRTHYSMKIGDVVLENFISLDNRDVTQDSQFSKFILDHMNDSQSDDDDSGL